MHGYMNAPDDQEKESNGFAQFFARGFLEGALKAFPRTFVLAGWVLSFLPRYIPEDSSAALFLVVWSLYIMTPFLLWRFFDNLDRKIERLFQNKEGAN